MARRVGTCINGCPGEQEIVAHGMCRTCYNKSRRDAKEAEARGRRYEGRGLTKELEELIKLRKAIDRTASLGNQLQEEWRDRVDELINQRSDRRPMVVKRLTTL